MTIMTAKIITSYCEFGISGISNCSQLRQICHSDGRFYSRFINARFHSRFKNVRFLYLFNHVLSGDYSLLVENSYVYVIISKYVSASWRSVQIKIINLVIKFGLSGSDNLCKSLGLGNDLKQNRQ